MIKIMTEKEAMAVVREKIMSAGSFLYCNGNAVTPF
jgi:hypothetical protein